MKRTRLLLCVALLALGQPARANVKVAGMFGANMVLQRSAAIPIWGWAGKGEKVTVAFNGATNAAVADENGKWMVKLGPFPAGGPYTMTIAGSNTLTIGNILVGDVWLASGQSNMQWPLSKMDHAEREAAHADYGSFRFMTLHGTAREPAANVSGSWVVCSPATAPDFSAPGFFFGRALHTALKVPIGVINTSEGSSAARCWISAGTQLANPFFKEALEEYKTFPARKQAYMEAVAKAKAAGTQPPSHVPFFEAYTDVPGFLYNARIHPLAPFGIKGVIWYQGENEALFRHGRVYKDQFPALIQNWRELWGQGDFPFLYVQLQPFGGRRQTPAESEWAEVRDGQRQTLKVKNTGMVVTTDICDPALHPVKKAELGKRLALAARAIAYGEKVEYSGPLFDKAEFKDGRATVSFTHVGGGLVAKGGKLEGFAIAGADSAFVWADAEISGNRVIVRSAKVPAPRAVRYAWADNPVGTLFNQEGLPASCFRTGE